MERAGNVSEKGQGRRKGETERDNWKERGGGTLEKETEGKGTKIYRKREERKGEKRDKEG